MAVQGYVTHAAANRRRFIGLFLGYIAGFELVGAFALTIVLLLVDRDHTILTNPGGYALRYAVPIALIAGLTFWRIYRGHSRHVTRMLDVEIVDRAQEPRFAAIAEEQCTALGVRRPRFGVIESPALTALSVGDGPSAGLIAVTRGLIDGLDDDELAAVLAHEASHIRNGDTRILAANHALKRTAVLFQTHNIMRVEDWRQMWLPLILPAMLPIMLAGGAATMLSMRYARWAQRGVKLSRDHIADGEAVRVTHFPEALTSALAKVDSRGMFERSYLVEGHLFDARVDREGSSHPAIADRVAAIIRLGAAMMDPARLRRDTRAASPARVRTLGRRAAQPSGRFHFAYDAEGRPLEQPPTPTTELLWLAIVDRPAYRRWTQACTAWYEWRESDGRDALGVTPKMVIPVAAVLMFLAVFHWPADGDPAKLLAIFNPAETVRWFQTATDEVNSGPFCSDSAFADGRCPGHGPRKVPALPAAAAAPHGASDNAMLIMPLFLMLLVGLAIFRSKALLWVFGVKKEDRIRRPERARVATPPPPVTIAPAAPPAEAPRRQGGFGRKLA